MTSNPESTTTQCERLRRAVLVAASRADIVEEIRHQLPRGYSSVTSREWASRPVESLVEALDDRGVTDRVLRARRRLSAAAALVEEAARDLDAAIDLWEGHPRSSNSRRS